MAKMEAGDPSVSIDLLTRSLIALGASPQDIARTIAGMNFKDRSRQTPRD